jgi:hypothetical protein
MIKSISTPLTLSLVASAVFVLSVMTPQANANETVALAKADRLTVRMADRNCSQQIWPDFETSCLRSQVAGTRILDARRIVAQR